MTFLLGMTMILIFCSMMNFLFSLSVYMVEFQLSSILTMNLSFSIILDWISVSFCFIVLLISFSVFWFASMYMSSDYYFYRFIWLLLSFVISMLLLIFSSSFFFLLLGWDGLGITSFLLIIYYQSYDSMKSGYLTLLINRIGDVLIIISMVFLVYNGTLNFFMVENSNFFLLFFSLIVFASLTKSAQYPFSSWLPAAMAAPTPVSALVHSSTLVTAGIYMLIRLGQWVSMTSWMLSLLMFVGSMTSLLGSLSALNEYDMKKIIALSTLSQLGIMVFTLGMNNIYLSLFHLYTHAMFKALLFMVAGWILMLSFGVQDMRSLGNVFFYQPFMAIIFFTSSLALMGAPFLSAYYSKHLIFELMLSSSINFMSFLLLIMSSVITCIYSIRMVKILILSKLNAPVMVVSNTMSNMNSKMPYILMSVMSIFSGKLFKQLVINFNFSYSIIKFNSILLFVILLVGVIMGVCFKYANFLMMSTMFFLTSFSHWLKKPFFFISYNLKFLDYGILEPKNLMENLFFKCSGAIFLMAYWPSKFNLLWFRMALIVIFLMFLSWLIY
uniref:NADH-ubiquinone oxidoreductase chain 5 n=1 Tax=Succineidae gen. n. sp. z RM-2021 TaxID=2871687 RepID=A0A977TKH6_9EUPU|nr:NADH dehydrogenase subunit 5 [Succineidae gen. n. sp. z RM-2021]